MQEILDYLYNLRRFGKETGAVRAQRALLMLGNPEKKLNVIHVAGTNGKGSVCAYMNEALLELGFSVGMFTSPHLVRVNERIRLNKEEISDEDFIKYYKRVREVSDKMVNEGFDGLAFFDFVFVMAVLYYEDNNPDYVILETGLGGKDDATAAIENKKLSVITSISLDHTEILGDTIEQIAIQKAGIIVPNTPVVYYKSNDEVGRIMEDTAAKCCSRAISVDEKSFDFIQMERKRIDFSVNNSYYRNNVFSIRNAGLYQMMNATLALNAISMLDGATDFDLEKIKNAFAKCVWAGRMESISDNIFIDGAHNPDGIKCFIETANKMADEESKAYLLFGAVCEKDYDQMIRTICHTGKFDGFVIAPLSNHRALALDVMVEEFNKYTDKPVYFRDNVKEAFEFAKSMLSGSDVLFCAGSLYLVGEIKALMGE